MNIKPLLDDCVGIRRINSSVCAAMPNRYFRPWTFVLRGSSHEIAQYFRRMGRWPKHVAQSFFHVGCEAEWQARDDCAASERVRICREHHGSHRSASREARYEDAPPVDAVITQHAVNHLPDRTRFTTASRGIFWNQLKQQLALFDATCCGISNTKP